MFKKNITNGSSKIKPKKLNLPRNSVFTVDEKLKGKERKKNRFIKCNQYPLVKQSHLISKTLTKS